MESVDVATSANNAQRPAHQGGLAERFRFVRGRTEALTEGLAPEDFVVQSMEDVSPTKWHLAHTSWFWEAFVLAPFDPGYQPFHPRYHYLFNSYYVQAGERHCRDQRGYLSRPTVREIFEYRKHVDEAMFGFLQRGTDGERDPSSSRLVELGLNHEQQHQELMLTDLKHVFSVNPLRPAYHPPSTGNGAGPKSDAEANPSPDSIEPLRWIEFSEGLYEIGHTGPGFHFDNESPRHRCFLEPFALAHRLATNAEYLAFLEDGGYQRPELWMSEGWARRQAERWAEPFYWEKRNGEWWTFTLSGMRPLHLDEPVCHLNWFEADAFARWSGARLPREDEWEVAARACSTRGNFAESGLHHPAPIADASSDPIGDADDRSTGSTTGPPASKSPSTSQLRQMFGDVWEWTSSAYSPYPGYRPPEGAIGEYNGKFMCGQFVLRGGSCATPRSHIRATYRNFFHPDSAWQFTGVRLARDTGR